MLKMLDLLGFQAKSLDFQGVAKYQSRDFVSRVHARSPSRGFAAARLLRDDLKLLPAESAYRLSTSQGCMAPDLPPYSIGLQGIQCPRRR